MGTWRGRVQVDRTQLCFTGLSAPAITEAPRPHTWPGETGRNFFQFNHLYWYFSSSCLALRSSTPAVCLLIVESTEYNLADEDSCILFISNMSSAWRFVDNSFHLTQRQGLILACVGLIRFQTRSFFKKKRRKKKEEKPLDVLHSAVISFQVL